MRKKIDKNLYLTKGVYFPIMITIEIYSNLLGLTRDKEAL